MKNKLLLMCLLLWAIFLTKAQIIEPRTPYKNPIGFSEQWYNFWKSKNFKAVCLQRDSLYTLAKTLQQDTTQKGLHIRDLIKSNFDCKNNYKKLENDYNHLFNSSMDKATQLNAALNQKNQELLERENKISEMSNALADREKRVSDLETALRRQDSLANALNNALRQALLNFASDDLKVEVKNGKVYVSLYDKLLFQSGKADVEEAGKEALKKLAGVINKNINIDIMVEGHTDNIPIKTSKYADNWDLSAARAINVVRLLTQSYDVSPKIVEAAAHGEFAPIANNSTPEGRAKNRRTEIILTPNLGKLYNIINREE